MPACGPHAQDEQIYVEESRRYVVGPWQPGLLTGYLSPMPSGPFRAVRYLGSWFTGRAGVSITDFEIDRGDMRVPVTLHARHRLPPSPPAWIVLHGITRPGRSHPTLLRFVRALASTGCVVAVPEIPEWRDLRLAPHVTLPTVRATVRALAEQLGVASENVGLIGFSFGAPQALAVVADPDVGTLLGGVVGFGGYCDLERTVHFSFTGEHDYAGQVHHLRPDPYGRWVVGSNYLTHVPGFEGAGDVARALQQLAALAGDEGLMAWDPRYDPVKEELRRSMSPDWRHLFDLFAPPSDDDPPIKEAADMATALSAAARRTDPGTDPCPVLGHVSRPVHILHGRCDHLIPYTEGLRLGHALNPEVLQRATVTRLFAHSRRDPLPGPIEGIKEGAVFLRALSSLLTLV